MYQPTYNIPEPPQPHLECPHCGSYDTVRSEADDDFDYYDCFACGYGWHVTVEDDIPF